MLPRYMQEWRLFMKNRKKPRRDGPVRTLFRSLTRKAPPAADAHPNQGDCWLNLASGVRVSDHDDGLAVLDTITGRVFVCNRLAAWIWLGASKGLSIDAVAEDIAIRYGVAHEQGEQDIREFVANLDRHGLIAKRT